jgi:uncharacterized coiled-coil protein SlyX
MKLRSSKRKKVHAHNSKHRRNPRPAGHTDAGRGFTLGVKLEQKVEPPPTALQEPGLRILGEIIASLEQSRDGHRSDLDLAIQRLKTVQRFAEKASETIAPKQRAPHTIGGFLVV